MGESGSDDITGKTKDTSRHDRRVNGRFGVVSHCHAKEHMIGIDDVLPNSTFIFP